MRRHALAILLLLAQPAFAGEKDKLYSSTLDVRTVLSFKVADSAAQKMLPQCAASLDLGRSAAGGYGVLDRWRSSSLQHFEDDAR